MKYLFKKVAKNQIAHHYDLSNEFYQLFLDKNMIYSCAYFSYQRDLDQAQKDKMDRICRKLRLNPGERLLDIGCGWGGLISWAAKHYGVIAHGVTISERQYEYAKNWIHSQGLSDQCKVSMIDYQDIKEEYDKVVSIEMLEHVGSKRLPSYFESVQRLLKAEGLFLVQMSTVNARRKKKVNPEYHFMNKHIFPGGILETIPQLLLYGEKAGLEVHDAECLRSHYVTTLECWTERLRSRKDEAIRLVGEEKYRAWLLYLAGCSYTHRRGDISVYQVLLSNSANSGSFLPLQGRQEDVSEFLHLNGAFYPNHDYEDAKSEKYAKSQLK